MLFIQHIVIKIKLLKTVKSQSPKIEISKQQPAMLRNCRMYVGGFPLTYTEDQARKLFSEYGTLTDMFYNKEKCFAFIKMVIYNLYVLKYFIKNNFINYGLSRFKLYVILFSPL